MTDQEFIDKAKEMYGSRGKRQAQEIIASIEKSIKHNAITDTLTKQAMSDAIKDSWFEHKEMNIRLYTPKKYRKEIPQSV